MTALALIALAIFLAHKLGFIKEKDKDLYKKKLIIFFRGVFPLLVLFVICALAYLIYFFYHKSMPVMTEADIAVFARVKIKYEISHWFDLSFIVLSLAFFVTLRHITKKYSYTFFIKKRHKPPKIISIRLVFWMLFFLFSGCGAYFVYATAWGPMYFFIGMLLALLAMGAAYVSYILLSKVL